MRAGCIAVTIVVLVVLVLVAGFFFLVLLRDLDVAWQEPGPGPKARPTPAPAPTPVPEDYLKHVGALNRFERTQAAGDFVLSYGFIDHHGRRQEITCRVARSDHERELGGFGYNRQSIVARTDATLQVWVDGELATRGLAAHVHLRVKDGSYDWKLHLPADPERREELRREAYAFLNRLYAIWGRRRDAVREAHYRERGFLLERGSLQIDYPRLVFSAQRPLNDCTRALATAAAEDSDRQRLGLFVAFFQELRYEVPPSLIDGRETGGLFVPTEVLVNDHGDCDSKSVAFAAMWRRFSSAMLLIHLPRHMLVGVEARPRPGLQSVRVGNRYFVLCEVAGPGKWHPGAKGVAGHFEYLLLEPAGEEPIRGESSP
jgi:hypothetical protein